MIIIEFWKQVAIYDLKRYANLETSINSIKDKIAALDIQLEGKGISYDTISVAGGSVSVEDKYVNCIALKENLEKQLRINMLDKLAVARAIESLSKEEQQILRYAYINRTAKPIKSIMELCCVEKTRAYQLRDNALRNFTLAMYGR